MTRWHDMVDFSKARVLVMGDVMLDHYFSGDCARISPEAPVPIVNITSQTSCPGGAANVALNCAALGADVSLIGFIGDDDDGTTLTTALDAAAVTSHLITVPDFKTISKHRVLGQQQQLVRFDFESVMPVLSLDVVRERLAALLPHVDVVVFSDYAKGVLHYFDVCIDMATKAGIPVIVDPKHNDFSVYRGATLLTPNLKEFSAAVGRKVDIEQVSSAARTQCERAGIHGLLVTLGRDGMLLVHDDVELALHAKAQEVFDVTGAGDTVIAVLSACIACGESYTEAATLANVAAGLAVKKLGNATVTPAELRRVLREEVDTHYGLVTRAQLECLVEDAQSHGEKVVFTNGCFDLLHAGHVQYLSQARLLGDRLIVAVNDDHSVRTLKGATRPLNGVEDRMTLLGALQCVDWVVSFSEETPAELIAALVPDVLVKGGDYTVQAIAGHDTVLAAGGEVKILPFKEGYSTTALIEKMEATS